MRAVLDTVIYNRAVENPDFGVLLKRVCDQGVVKLLSTHVQRDQLSDTTDDQKRDQLLTMYAATFVELASTAAFVWDVSRWDQAEWPDDERVQFFKQTLLGTEEAHAGHANDGLLAVTAFAKADVFVTDDRKLLTKETYRVTL